MRNSRDESQKYVFLKVEEFIKIYTWRKKERIQCLNLYFCPENHTTSFLPSLKPVTFFWTMSPPCSTSFSCSGTYNPQDDASFQALETLWFLWISEKHMLWEIWDFAGFLPRKVLVSSASILKEELQGTFRWMESAHQDYLWSLCYLHQFSLFQVLLDWPSGLEKKNVTFCQHACWETILCFCILSINFCSVVFKDVYAAKRIRSPRSCLSLGQKAELFPD